LARRDVADQAAHRLTLKMERLRAQGIAGKGTLANPLNARQVPTPTGAGTWIHTSVARVLARAASRAAP
jgi:hypothetical protein